MQKYLPYGLTCRSLCVQYDEHFHAVQSRFKPLQYGQDEANASVCLKQKERTNHLKIMSKIAATVSTK